MSEFIGKFTAPGTGDVGVLGIELTHDLATDTKEGVVCLEKRPYWEGGATPFTLEMPATSERAAMHLTGLWIARGDFDGEGCNVTVTGVTMRSAAPAAPTLDELTDPADLDWGTIRSTCAARDWRAAWGVVGTDHTGDATPGEVYLLAVARRASATAAALCHWRHVCEKRRDVTLAPGNVSWQRIKRIAAWESSARAQAQDAADYRERMRIRHSFSGMKVMVGGRELKGMTPEWSAVYDNMADQLQAAMPAGVRIFGDDRADELTTDWMHRVCLYGHDNVGNDTLDALRQLSAATQAADTTVRPTHMWIDEATLDALRQQAAVIDDPVELDPELYGNGRGVVGVLNNPFLTAAAQRGEITGTMTITASEPVSFDAAAAVESELRHQLGALIGQPITQATRARAEQIAANVLRDAQRTANPAPRGPQTRKRR